MHVEIHPFDPISVSIDNVRHSAEKCVADSPNLVKRPRGMASLTLSGFRRVGLAHWDPEPITELPSLLVPMRVWVAALWRSLGGTPVTVNHFGCLLSIPPLGPISIGDLDNWRLAWGLAWATRDQALVDALIDAGPIPNTPRPGLTRLPYYLAFVEAFLHFQRQQPGWVDACEEAVRLASPEVAGADYPYTQDAHTLVRLMLAFRHLDDVEAFDRALVAALLAHRDKQIRFAPPNDFIGLIAWPILGLAARAHDLGVPFTTTSDYLPPAILLNRFG